MYAGPQASVLCICSLSLATGSLMTLAQARVFPDHCALAVEVRILAPVCAPMVFAVRRVPGLLPLRSSIAPRSLTFANLQAFAILAVLSVGFVPRLPTEDDCVFGKEALASIGLALD